MALGFPFGFYVSNGLPLDSKYSKDGVPYIDEAEVLSILPLGVRYEGLKVRIGNADFEFQADLVTLVPVGGGGDLQFEQGKTIGSTVAKNRKGPGQVSLVNGSAIVTGIGTNFLDNSPIGMSYWFQMFVIDSSGEIYRSGTITIQSATQLTSAQWWNEAAQDDGYANPGVSTFPGVTGVYDYYIGIYNYADNFSFAWGAGGTRAFNFSNAIGSECIASGAASFSAGRINVATGTQSIALGFSNYSEGIASIAAGRRVRASGDGAFAGGYGISQAGQGVGDGALDRRIRASARASFNHSENTAGQIQGHGANAQGSAILGGLNHDIPSTSPRSVILGGNTIKARPNDPDQVYVPKLNIVGPLSAAQSMTFLTIEPGNPLIKQWNKSYLQETFIAENDNSTWVIEKSFASGAFASMNVGGYFYDNLEAEVNLLTFGPDFIDSTIGVILHDNTGFIGLAVSNGTPRIGFEFVADQAIPDNDSFSFIDSRGIKKGIQYSLDYILEDDLSLLHKAQADRNYLKALGTSTIQTGPSQINVVNDGFFDLGEFIVTSVNGGSEFKVSDYIYLNNLPTTNPGISGALWNNAGVLTIVP